MKAWLKIMAIVLLIMIIGGIADACGANDRYEMDGVDWGANYDWGEHHYWDTNKHSVQEKPW